MKMLNNGKTSARQFKVLIFLYTIGSTILIIPSGLAATAKQDAWIGGARRRWIWLDYHLAVCRAMAGVPGQNLCRNVRSGFR